MFSEPSCNERTCNRNLLCHQRCFSAAGVVIIYLPFSLGWKNSVHSFPSCGFVYYLINAIIALIGIVAYTCCSEISV